MREIENSLKNEERTFAAVKLLAKCTPLVVCCHRQWAEVLQRKCKCSQEDFSFMR